MRFFRSASEAPAGLSQFSRRSFRTCGGLGDGLSLGVVGFREREGLEAGGGGVAEARLRFAVASPYSASAQDFVEYARVQYAESCSHRLLANDTSNCVVCIRSASSQRRSPSTKAFGALTLWAWLCIDSIQPTLWRHFATWSWPNQPPIVHLLLNRRISLADHVRA